MYFCGGSSHPISHRGGVSSERHGGKRGGGRQPDTNTDADGSGQLLSTASLSVIITISLFD